MRRTKSKSKVHPFLFPQVKKTRAELMKDVDAQYYGFRDDDDGLLVRLKLTPIFWKEIKTLKSFRCLLSWLPRRMPSVRW